MTADHTFRPFLPDDTHRVMDLYRLSIQPTWLRSGRDHDMRRVEVNIRAHVGARDYWMTVVGPGPESPTSPLQGYLAWERHEDHTSHHVVAHLRMILVHPDTQGSGLGRQLMDRFEGDARRAGCTKVMFDVVTGSPAREFYDRLGYRHWSDYMEKPL